MKMMRRATGRPVVIGVPSAATTASRPRPQRSAPRPRRSAAGLRGLVPGFVHVPYPHPYRSPFREPRPGGSGDATVDYLRDHVLFHAVDPTEVAGVVIEPVLGSGGCVAPPDSFWPALTRLCSEHGWLLCADEVKTGFGRSGHMFAVERWGLEPDLICLGKAMGGGVMPIGAVLGSERAMGGFDDVPTGSTWSWLPASCAAALATLGRVRARAGAREREGAGTCRGRAARQDPRPVRAGRRRPRGRLLPGDRVRRATATTKERDPELQDKVAAEACGAG